MSITLKYAPIDMMELAVFAEDGEKRFDRAYCEALSH